MTRVGDAERPRLGDAERPWVSKAKARGDWNPPSGGGVTGSDGGGESGLSYLRDGHRKAGTGSSCAAAGLAPFAPRAMTSAKTPDGRFEPGGGGIGLALAEGGTTRTCLFGVSFFVVNF